MREGDDLWYQEKDGRLRLAIIFRRVKACLSGHGQTIAVPMANHNSLRDQNQWLCLSEYGLAWSTDARRLLCGRFRTSGRLQRKAAKIVFQALCLSLFDRERPCM